MQGFLTKYFKDGGYGFIKVRNQNDVFLSVREAHRCGVHELQEGMCLVFEVKQTEKGNSATNIRVVSELDPLDGLTVLSTRDGVRAEIFGTIIYAGDVNELRQRASQLLEMRGAL